jgi:tetratricopeptide (TPR) repeat protein
MLGFIIRCILTAVSLFLTVYSFGSGHWGWGIVMIFVTALVVLTFFRNVYMIMALNQMRVGNQEKAHDYIKKITRPDLLPKKQHAYILYLKAMMGAQEMGFAKSEQLMRTALQMGLRTKQDNAMARMHLAGLTAQTGRRQEALSLLSEAKKLDENGILKDQISMMRDQLTGAIPSKNQMRMAQMHKGRIKSPRKR